MGNSVSEIKTEIYWGGGERERETAYTGKVLKERNVSALPQLEERRSNRRAAQCSSLLVQ
jgi:hypothetical protein